MKHWLIVLSDDRQNKRRLDNMNKTSVILAALMVVMVMPSVLAGPVVQVDLGGGVTYQEEKFVPLLFLNENGGRTLFDDPYGFYANGNIQTRTNNYGFTGEQVQWKVLAWDKNGVEKMGDVFAGWITQTNGPLDPNQQVNCQRVSSVEQTGLSSMGYSNVRRPGDQEAQINFDPNSMQEYLCTLTIEPGCLGQKWFGVKIVDIDGLSSTLQEAESWFCNPELDLYVSGTLDFGTLGPGEQGAATFSVENAAETGSGVEVVLAISATDFYDPISSGAKCPTSNVLEQQGFESVAPFVTGFWYTAVQGSKSVGPKRIPYGNDITSSDPIFSTSTAAQSWKKWTGTLVPTAPGAETTMTLRLGLPIPCNGQFTDGHIYLYAWAI